MITIIEKFLTGLGLVMGGGGKAITRTASTVKNNYLLDPIVGILFNPKHAKPLKPFLRIDVYDNSVIPTRLKFHYRQINTLEMYFLSFGSLQLTSLQFIL
jgi:hypothetical protein